MNDDDYLFYRPARSAWTHGEFDRAMARIVDSAQLDREVRRTTREIKERVSMNRDEVIRARIRELERELAQRERYGVDNYPDGTVLRWDKTYPNVDEVYKFAAIKANGTWHPTGRVMPANCTWDKLVEVWTNQNVVEVVREATLWAPIGAASEREEEK